MSRAADDFGRLNRTVSIWTEDDVNANPDEPGQAPGLAV
jgi:hypothetical protein